MNQLFEKVRGGKLFEDLQNREESYRFWGSDEMFILIAAILILAVALFTWAAFIRKPKKLSSAKSLPPAASLKISRNLFPGGKRGRERRWKRRNPTLSETGGLPPRKSENTVSNSH